MSLVPFGKRSFKAHTIALLEDEFAWTIMLDGRQSVDDGNALSLQFAINPEDGAEPYIEIPPQRYASDGGLIRCVIDDDSVYVDVDGEAGEHLDRTNHWHIIMPPERRSELISFAGTAFRDHKDLLKVTRA